MRKFMRCCVMVGVMVGFVMPAAHAQQARRMLERYDQVYDKEGFDRLSDGDQYITRDSYFENLKGREDNRFAEERWERAMRFDKDGDGQLSRQEARRYRDAERRRLIHNKKDLKRMKKHKQWIRQHPEAAKEIFKRRQHLKKHPRAVKKAYQAAQRHKPEAGKVFRDAKRHPQKAARALRVADRHHGSVRKAYRTAQREPSRVKRAYRAGKGRLR